ncbi:methyl-accepting chemotaxis protein [Bradyrhizobium yuanmingense]
MRIGKLFALSMLTVTVFAVILGAEVLIPQARIFTNRSDAIKTVEAFGAMLTVSQHVAGLRAPYITPVFQEGAATQAQTEAAAKAAKAADAGFEAARRALMMVDDSATLIETLDRAARRLKDLYTAADRAMSVPLAARDSAVVKGFLPAVAEVISNIEPIMNRLEGQVVNADSSLAALLSLARTAQDLRVSAGSRAATLSPALSARRPLVAAEFSLMDRMQGRVEIDRERIEAGMEQLGNPPRIATALKAATESYFGKAALAVEKEMPAARADGKYGITADELAKVIVPAIQMFYGVRDAALAEAAERASAARDGALAMLALAGVAVLALLGTLGGVTIMLRKRVVTPLGRIADVIGALAAGQHEVEIPATGRSDEIGQVAGSLQHFKDSLLAKKSADEAAAIEAEAKLKRSQRMDQIAREFEAMIGDVINTVSSASSELEASAGTLTSTAEQSEKVTATVAAASEQASTNVQTVAAAAEEMASSVDEISRQVQDSARIAGEAVQQAGRTNEHVGELARAAGRIGDVVELISQIAGPDQPSGAQRHHRGGARRRGRSRLRRRRVRGQGAGRADRQGHRRDQPADLGHPDGDGGLRRRHQVDRRHHLPHVRDRVRNRRGGRGAGRSDARDFPQRAAGCARHPAGLRQHRRRAARCQPDRIGLLQRARIGKVTLRRKQPPQDRGRKIPGCDPRGVTSVPRHLRGNRIDVPAAHPSRRPLSRSPQSLTEKR